MSLQEYTQIRDGAIFLADSHHAFYRDTLSDFFAFLIESAKIKSTKNLDSIESKQKIQLFLLGDIFDFLVGGIKQSQRDNAEVLGQLETLSELYEIYYFEGNHDFNLSQIPQLSQLKVFSIKEQPVFFALPKNAKLYSYEFNLQNTENRAQNEISDSIKEQILCFESADSIFNLELDSIKKDINSLQKTSIESNNKKSLIILAHGDLKVGLKYKIYASLIRNRAVLSFLNFLNFFFPIYQKILKHLQKKSLKVCKNADFLLQSRVNFYKIFFKNLLKRENAEFIQSSDFSVFEGHFHLGKGLGKYFCLDGFYCKRKYFVVKSVDFESKTKAEA